MRMYRFDADELQESGPESGMMAVVDERSNVDPSV